MGPCLSKKGKQIQIIEDFRADINNSDDTIQPLFSTLYNVLRKTKDLQIINESSHKLFKNETNPDFSDLRPTSLKMLYSFKNIVWIGNKTQNLQKIKENTNPKKILIVTYEHGQQFLKKYPIFSYKQSEKYRTIQIPLMVFSSDDLKKQKKGKHLEIFLHTQDHKNSQLYHKLSITQSIKASAQNSQLQLQTSKAERIAYLHSKQTQQNQLLRVITDAIIKRYNTDQLATKIYLRNALPHTQLIDNVNNQDQAPIMRPETSSKQRPKQQQTIEDQQKRFLKKLYKQMGENREKIQRAHNLLITLLSNIYTNRESENYRTIRKTNKQINEMIGKYKNGVQLLKLNGFEDDGGNFVNTMDVKYLKVYRTDLDLAFKHFTEQNFQ